VIRFLIADDEPQIRKGLRGLVAQIVPDAEFAEAEDGLDAFDKAQSFAPDILLLDIHMPRLKGLDLVARLNGLGRDWLILIVTGHDEFEYARTALSLQVFDFLLKPVPEAQFRAVVERARDELAQRREQRRFADWSKDRLAQQRDLFRETLLRDWLEGRVEAAEFDRSAGYLGLSLPARPSLVLVGGWGEGQSHRSSLAVRQAAAGWAGALVVEDSRHHLAVITDRESTGGWRAVAARLGTVLGDSAAPVEGLDREAPGELPEAWQRLSGLVAGPLAEGGLVQAAQGLLETRYRDPDLSLEAVADHLKITPNYLSRLLKAATGRSFVNYLCHLRMEKAKVLLEDPRLRIAEVADRVGYRDQNYFCRHFKTVTGRTPKSWRTGEAET